MQYLLKPDKILTVNIVARIKLDATKEQVQALRDTMFAYNAASNWVSKKAWEANIYGKYDIQKEWYQDIRATFPSLKANHVIRIISRVSQAYKTLNRNERRAYAKFKNGEAEHWYRDLRSFKWHNGIELDERLWGYLKDNSLSMASVNGRIKHIAWFTNEHNTSLMKNRTGSATLVYRRGRFFLHVTCEAEEKPIYQASDFIGVDLGVVNIAVTSDKESWNSKEIENKRQWYAWRRQQLQKVGTDSAKRRLQKLSGREQRFKRDVDHCISKHIVTNAERTGRGIALEQLQGIRDRTRAIRKGQRARHHSWSFYRLQEFINYKAKLAGVEVIYIDPAYTSQECSECGYISKSNRKSQDKFVCGSCNYSEHADLNASFNIRNRAIQQAYG